MSCKGKAYILSIGNELLIGKIINTNASWLAQRLTLLGYCVERIIALPDRVEDIVEEFQKALTHADIVLSTGGLGPTPDDITNIALAQALGRELEVNPEALRIVQEKYAKRGYPMTPEREKMAKLPRGAKPLPNPVGTAPGILVETDSRLIIVLPGVPAEMEAIFSEHVEPLLRSRGKPHFYQEKMVRIRGVPEADLTPILRRALKIDERAYVKSHPRGLEAGAPVVEIHIYASSSSEEEAKAIVERVEQFLVEEVRKTFGDSAKISILS
ncbi:MAG: nicotinamide mononucleotide deamidase-related protein [Thermofilum sp.]|nr:nicotinamide mononucleotide deamidase-related protein [Thermofilum sp.]